MTGLRSRILKNFFQRTKRANNTDGLAKEIIEVLGFEASKDRIKEIRYWARECECQINYYDVDIYGDNFGGFGDMIADHERNNWPLYFNLDNKQAVYSDGRRAV